MNMLILDVPCTHRRRKFDIGIGNSETGIRVKTRRGRP